MDGRPGPKAASVAKREASYGPKSGPNAGSRASSPGEQAAACDYIRTRELGYKTRKMACPRDGYINLFSALPGLRAVGVSAADVGGGGGLFACADHDAGGDLV